MIQKFILNNKIGGETLGIRISREEQEYKAWRE